MRIVSLARAVITTSGRPVAKHAVPLMCGLAVIAAIVFAPHGMRARDATQILAASPIARVVAWSAWVMLARSATAVAFDAPGTRTLRSLRPSTMSMTVLVTLLLVSVQLPWAVLMARGDGATRGASATLLAVALATSMRDALRSREAFAVFACAAAIVVVDPPQTLVVLPAATLAFVATRVSWRDALDVGALDVRIVRRSHPVAALALGYLAQMVRTARGRLGAAAMVFAAGGAALALTLRNDPDARPWQRALVVFVLPSSIAAGLLAAPAIDTEARLRPWLRQTRTPTLMLAAAVALALATPTTALASTAGAIAASAAHAPPSIAGVSALTALLMASAVAVWARRASRSPRPATFVMGVVVIAVSTTMLVAAC